MEQARQDYDDGQPELLFPHVYHSSSIEDIQWRPTYSHIQSGVGTHFDMSLASLETTMQM